MYAVLVTGGKQYRVAQGDTLRVEKLDVEAGSEIKFDNILMLDDGVYFAGITLTLRSFGTIAHLTAPNKRECHIVKATM